MVDLNGRENTTSVALKIQDKTFKISRIVTGARVKYSNLLKQQAKLFDEISNIDSDNEEDALALSARWNDFAEELPSLLLEVIELLLTKNGYGYDEDWWNENCDIQDYRNFIDAALSKDSDHETSKKKH